MDTPERCEHPEPTSGIGPSADSRDHPAMRRLADRLRQTDEAERERLEEFLRAADDGKTKVEKETDGDGASEAGN